MIAKHIDRFPLLKLDQVIDWQPINSTLCRYRNWLAQDNTLSELLELINRQLTEKGLKVEKSIRRRH